MEVESVVGIWSENDPSFTSVPRIRAGTMIEMA